MTIRDDRLPNRRDWLGHAVDSVMQWWLGGMDPANGDEATEALMEWWQSQECADAALEIVHVVVQAIEERGYYIAIGNIDPERETP